MEIFAVKILKDIDQAHLEDLLSQLDREKQQIIFSMKNLHARSAALTSALLIRHVIKIKLGLSGKEIVFAKNKYGKPYLALREDFHFNLSRSGDWAVCVIDESPVGIDIEKIDYEHPKIILEVLSSSELAIYKNLNPGDKISFFYNIWTRKESYVKALGIGLNVPLDALTVYLENEKDIFSPIIENITNNKYFFKQYFINSYYSMTVCAMNKSFSGSITLINNGDLLESSLN